MTDIIPTYKGEVMLAGWSDSHTRGQQITFWIPPDENFEIFKGMTVKKGNTAGQRFAMVLVEIGDDEQPVAPTIKDSFTVEKPKGGKLAKLAGMWCNDHRFKHFILRIYDMHMGGNGNGYGDLDPEALSDMSDDEICAHCIYVLCEIESRAELDNNPEAAKLFNERIRIPYMKWMEDNK